MVEMLSGGTEDERQSCDQRPEEHPRRDEDACCLIDGWISSRSNQLSAGGGCIKRHCGSHRLTKGLHELNTTTSAAQDAQEARTTPLLTDWWIVDSSGGSFRTLLSALQVAYFANPLTWTVEPGYR